ncbi:2Fe-2S iron-sulfur cluster-binding protein [Halioxenophilus aromaticivorans]|uniref:2Fe-2S ferredoxin-type domain-containing protein n=1 Tax=Halioxenophilus aromaticivorans TaxID=1306992 RepID=A0AAV3TYL0_9ALTE
MNYIIRVIDDELDIDESFGCNEDESVLHAMHRTGRKGIPLGCRGGGCGVCTVQVKKGHYSHKAMSACHISEDDLANDTVLACRIFPEQNLELCITGKIRRRFAAKANPMLLASHRAGR